MLSLEKASPLARRAAPEEYARDERKARLRRGRAAPVVEVAGHAWVARVEQPDLILEALNDRSLARAVNRARRVPRDRGERVKHRPLVTEGRVHVALRT
jgi:hypothetical protein